jgi:hypothetical protein
MALHARLLGDHADRGLCRPDPAVQVDRGLDDSLPRLRLLLGAPPQRIGATFFHCTHMCT